MPKGQAPQPRKLSTQKASEPNWQTMAVQSAPPRATLSGSTNFNVGQAAQLIARALTSRGAGFVSPGRTGAVKLR